MVLSRSILVKNLKIFIAKNFNIDINALRLWLLEINGNFYRQMITDDSLSLYDLGIYKSAQVFNFFFMFSLILKIF